jgi:hypothetical protein
MQQPSMQRSSPGIQQPSMQRSSPGSGGRRP